MKKLIILLLCVIAQSCATVSSVDRVASIDRPYSHDNPQTDEPLLGTNATALADGQINTLLSRDIKYPKQIRIAILKLSNDNYWQYYSDEFTQLTDSLKVKLIDKLRASGRVYDASFLPSMLIPEKRTLQALRESAARFQADVLMTYRSHCDSFQKYRYFSADETKSYCTIEAILLDVRTGIVSKSVVSTQEFFAKKTDKDLNFEETVKKSELEAISKGLGEVALEIVSHLDKVKLL